MQMLDNVIILSLIVGAFFLGRYITMRDNEKLLDYYNYFYRMDAAKQGVGYVAPPVRRKAHLDDQFMERLKTNGRATQAIK